MSQLLGNVCPSPFEDYQSGELPLQDGLQIMDTFSDGVILNMKPKNVHYSITTKFNKTDSMLMSKFTITLKCTLEGTLHGMETCVSLIASMSQVHYFTLDESVAYISTWNGYLRTYPDTSNLLITDSNLFDGRHASVYSMSSSETVNTHEDSILEVGEVISEWAANIHLLFHPFTVRPSGMRGSIRGAFVHNSPSPANMHQFKGI